MSKDQVVHDANHRAGGYPWCDTCQHAALFREGEGLVHSTPQLPFGHARHSTPFGDHKVTIREWSAAFDAAFAAE